MARKDRADVSTRAVASVIEPAQHADDAHMVAATVSTVALARLGSTFLVLRIKLGSHNGHKLFRTLVSPHFDHSCGRYSLQ